MARRSDARDHGHPGKSFHQTATKAWFSLQAVFRRASAAHFCVITNSRPLYFLEPKYVEGAEKCIFLRRQAGRLKIDPTSPSRRDLSTSTAQELLGEAA